MAWIRWCTTKRGERLASIQWRKDGRVRTRTLKTSDPRIAEMHRQVIETAEEGRAPGAITVHAGEALGRFLTSVALVRAARHGRGLPRETGASVDCVEGLPAWALVSAAL